MSLRRVNIPQWEQETWKIHKIAQTSREKPVASLKWYGITTRSRYYNCSTLFTNHRRCLVCIDLRSTKHGQQHIRVFGIPMGALQPYQLRRAGTTQSLLKFTKTGINHASATPTSYLPSPILLRFFVRQGRRPNDHSRRETTNHKRRWCSGAEENWNLNGREIFFGWALVHNPLACGWSHCSASHPMLLSCLYTDDTDQQSMVNRKSAASFMLIK